MPAAAVPVGFRFGAGSEQIHDTQIKMRGLRRLHPRVPGNGHQT
jgi:hypothetical protein